MYTLYWTADSGAFVVQAVLEELGQPYHREIVVTAAGEQHRPDYRALNPMAQVPTLRLPDGTVITESAAMLVHLCDAHPEPSLLPPPGTSARARAYRWLFWLATGLYEADLRYFYADRYTADPQGTDGVKTAALARMDRLVTIAEDLLDAGPYVLGERFSVVDLYLFMLVLWHPAGTEVHHRRPGLGKLMRLVRRRPAVERIWAQHYPSDGDSPWSTWTGSSGS